MRNSPAKNSIDGEFSRQYLISGAGHSLKT